MVSEESAFSLCRNSCQHSKNLRENRKSPLAPDNPPPHRIVLTGFMGSGKSTVGPLVAAQLGWRFIDIDNVIEAEAGSAIAELFARNGEQALRDRGQAQ